jgi:hypothetical protein
MTVADDFVSVLLKARSMGHVAHWATDSFSKHMALGEFYSGVGDLVDGFVEQYQGYYDKRMKPQVDAADTDKDITDEIEMQLEWIERKRYEVCDKDETALQNTIDEIVGLYQTTLYKLRMLK